MTDPTPEEIIYVIQHSGLQSDNWHIFESVPHLTKTNALDRLDELAEIHGAVLKFRVTEFVPRAAVEAEREACAKEVMDLYPECGSLELLCHVAAAIRKRGEDD